jgi:hypothetical protein
LLDNGIKHFDLEEALLGTDMEFCKKFELHESKLEEKKKERKHVPEKDQLWNYVPGI